MSDFKGVVFVKQKGAKVNTTLLFVILQTILYVIFLTLDLTDSSTSLSNGIKFSIIVLCFCYALIFGKGTNKSIIFCLQAALFFTVISDLLILILDYYFYGVVTFIIVQQIYDIYLTILKFNRKAVEEKSVKPFVYVLLRRFMFRLAIAFLIYFLLGLVGINLEGLIIVSVYYFICIFTNAISAASIAIQRKNNMGVVLFTIGILLFLLCDINVGLFNISGFITMPEKIYRSIYSISSILMWTFYAPAQVLISLSTSKFSLIESSESLKK
jgi:hypothetical protein